MNAVSGRVIVVGSVNVDVVMRLPRLPAPGETVLGGLFARHQGGKGANQAVAAARAGARVFMVGAVGAADGEDSVQALAAEGIGVEYVARITAPTGHAVVLVDAASGENQIGVAAGANAKLSPAHVAAALEQLSPGPADVVVLSFELPAEALREAARHGAAGHARVVVNPAPAEPGRADLLAGAIVTPNSHELAALLGSTGALLGEERQIAALALADRTASPVIVTMGGDGALLADGGGVLHVPGRRVEATDTTGAGDTLTGVLAASLAQRHDLSTSLRRAVAAAGLAVTREGARTGMPTAAEIDTVLDGP